MGSPGLSSSIVRFREFELDVRTGELRRNGLRQRLQGQPAQLLAFLVCRPGRLIPREELRKELWPKDTFVDFDHGLNNAVNRIREVLEDSSASPRYIETVPRRGYRFIAQVEVAGPNLVTLGAPRKQPAEPVSKLRPSPQRWPWVLGVAAVLAVIAFFAARRAFWPSAPHIESVAVLPFANLSGDHSQDYFVDGMTDELINDLSKLGTMRVISRTSVMRYKGTSEALPQIGRDLKVDVIVEGTVERAGDRVRIRAQLIRAATEQSLWADSYDREMRDVLALQSDAAGDIIDHIRGKVTVARVTTRTVDPEVYDLYLRGRYYWNQRTHEGFDKAISYFNRALAKDPANALAYAGLADCYSLQGDPRGKAAAEKAVGLDNSLAEAHTSLAYAKQNLDWDFMGAEKEFRRALQLNPNYVNAHQWYAAFLSDVGRDSEAIAEIERALQLDPLSVRVSTAAVYVFYAARQFDRAEKQGRAASELDPQFYGVHDALAVVFMAQDRIGDGLDEEKKFAVLINNKGALAFNDVLRRVYFSGGAKAYYREFIRPEAARSDSQYLYGIGMGPLDVAAAYAKLGDNDHAFAVLDEMVRTRDYAVLFIKADPRLDRLRSASRFAALLRRIGFPN